jgi:NAD(P) transhydrogenase
MRVNDHYQTKVPHIYAVGDVIGFPSLASTSMEQGRLAACHAFGVEAHSFPELFPYGIFTIPGMSMVGKTEEELTAAGVPYEFGVSRYKETARGQILGDHNGMLKILFHRESRLLLGVISSARKRRLVHIAPSALGGRSTTSSIRSSTTPRSRSAIRPPPSTASTGWVCGEGGAPQAGQSIAEPRPTPILS